MTEAIATLLLPHELRDHPEAEPLVKSGAAIAFNNISFGISRRFAGCSTSSRCGCNRASASASSASPVAASPACSRCLQRFYDVQQGDITVDGQDIARVTQQSLRQAIRWWPQDISLFPPHDPRKHPLRSAERLDDEVLRAAIAARCDFRGGIA